MSGAKATNAARERDEWLRSALTPEALDIALTDDDKREYLAGVLAYGAPLDWMRTHEDGEYSLERAREVIQDRAYRLWIPAGLSVDDLLKKAASIASKAVRSRGYGRGLGYSLGVPAPEGSYITALYEDDSDIPFEDEYDFLDEPNVTTTEGLCLPESIASALDGLTPRQREVINQTIVAGKTDTAAAAELGISGVRVGQLRKAALEAIKGGVLV